jgi:hypothetical protein
MEHGTPDPESLIPRGWQRAGSWASLFAAGAIGSDYPKPDVVYAANPAQAAQPDVSKRPWETVLPLCERLHIKPDIAYGVGDEAGMVGEATALTGVVLICWEHKNSSGYGGNEPNAQRPSSKLFPRLRATSFEAGTSRTARGSAPDGGNCDVCLCSDRAANLPDALCGRRSIHQRSRGAPDVEVFNHFGNLFSRARRTEQVSLDLGAGLRSQQPELSGRFDAFGRDGHSQRDPQIHDGVDDGGRLRARIQVSDE